MKRLKSSSLCHCLYVKDEHEHMCMLLKKHDGACNGHETSRSLVPVEANKLVISFVGTIFFWKSFEIPGVWLAYANPPHDVMTQGRPAGGHDSAIASLMHVIHANRLIEREG